MSDKLESWQWEKARLDPLNLQMSCFAKNQRINRALKSDGNCAKCGKNYGDHTHASYIRKYPKEHGKDCPFVPKTIKTWDRETLLSKQSFCI